MKVQLAVICIGVYSKATSSGDSYDVSTVNQEEDLSQYSTLPCGTPQVRNDLDDSSITCETDTDSLGSITQEGLNPG